MMQGWINENLSVIATIDPQAVANTELFTDVVDMSKFHKVMGVALLGGWAAETIDFDAYTCDSAGNNAAALKSTQQAAHATNNDNTQVVVEVKGDDLSPDTSNKDRYIKFGLVSGSTTGGTGAVLVLGEAKQKPATNHNLASVTEVETDLD